MLLNQGKKKENTWNLHNKACAESKNAAVERVAVGRASWTWTAERERTVNVALVEKESWKTWTRTAWNVTWLAKELERQRLSKAGKRKRKSFLNVNVHCCERNPNRQRSEKEKLENANKNVLNVNAHEKLAKNALNVKLKKKKGVRRESAK